MAYARLILTLVGFGVVAACLLLASRAPTRVSEQVRAEAEARLADAGADWASVRVEGRTVTLLGEAPDQARLEAALTALRAEAGPARTVFAGALAPAPAPTLRDPALADTDNPPSIESAPEIFPGEWTIAFDGDMARLTGESPDGLEREILIQTLRDGLGALMLDDQSEISDTAVSQAWFETAMRTARTLPLLTEGVIDYEAGVFSVTGTARDRGALEAANDALRLPSPPYLIDADLTVAASAAEPRQAALAEQSDLSDISAPASSSGSTDLAGSTDRAGPADLAGNETDPATSGIVEAPDPVTVASERAERCDRLLDDQLRDFHIRFASASSEIGRGTARLLTDIAAVLRRCGAVRVEIGGHTDSSGKADANQRLSERRARAVAAFLRNQGTGAARLTSRGYGASNPIASNASAAGRTRNRRIEFVVTSILTDNTVAAPADEEVPNQ